jgi:hypothetical protein
MTKLVVGCSFTQDAPWPEILWPDQNIINLGQGGAGNDFISRMVIESILFDQSIDEVFILYSHFSRVDYKYPKEAFEIMSKLREQGYSGRHSVKKNNAWIHTNDGMTEKNLKIHPVFEQIVKLQFLRNKGKDDYSTINNLINISVTNKFLEQMKIPYHWSLIIDPRDIDTHNVYGTYPVHPKHPLWTYTHLEKYIEPAPFKWAVKNKFISDDEFHPTYQGYQKWGRMVKDQIDKNRKGSMLNK